MLHQHVLQFFDRIEFETGPFSNSFFDSDFLDIVKRHPTVLRKRSRDIYEVIKTWSQQDRSDLCQLIRDSNDIENICEGNFVPPTIDKDATGLNKQLRDFYLDLYNQVIDGAGFTTKYNTTLRQHFDDFSTENRETTLCPICGIGELKKKEDATRDQYDHFLPKALYPFSSVNFENLVPSCKECNSFDAKGDDDTIAVSTGKLFYPFDNSHKGISVEFHIATDNIEPEKVDWRIDFTNPDGKNDEIESWKAIYKIDTRYSGHVKARIDKWYRRYWEHMHDRDIFFLTTKRRKKYYLKSLQREEDLGLAFLRKPALEGFINESIMAKAELDARYYS
jgi:5-methylcytosine-specific restriction endonuclease McrA